MQFVIYPSGVEQAVREMNALPAQAARATASALRKTGRSLQTRIKREAARELRLPQKFLARRFYVSRVKVGAQHATLWIGLRSLRVEPLGTVGRYGETGAKFAGVMVVGGSRRLVYRGAFLAKMQPDAPERIYIRLSSKHFDPALYPIKAKTQQRLDSGEPFGGRFPVVRPAIPISGPIIAAVGRVREDAVPIFEKIFASELNYQVNVRGKKK
ncbi:MAG: phage tail protein [Desulfobulbus sp.]|jgi:hypothetical protein